MINLRKEKGQTLLEVLVALAVVVLVIVALIKATTYSLKGSDFSKTQALATRYAQEAIEWTRAERDKSWDNLADRSSADGSTYCLTSLSWPGAGGCSESGFLEADNRFKREVVLKNVGGEGNRIEVRVEVSWQDASGEHHSRLETYLSNWR